MSSAFARIPSIEFLGSDWTVEEVGAWLRSIRMGQHACTVQISIPSIACAYSLSAAFAKEGITGRKLAHFTAPDIERIVKPKKDREAILEGVRNMTVLKVGRFRRVQLNSPL